MFVVLIAFPPIQEGRMDAFEEWFAWSNEQFSKFEGFISRKLLKPLEGGNYAGVAEFESQAAFQAMHDSAMHAEAGKRVRPLFAGQPTPKFYKVVA